MKSFHVTVFAFLLVGCHTHEDLSKPGVASAGHSVASKSHDVRGELATGGPLESLKWRRKAMLDENGVMDPLGMSKARAQRKINIEFAETTDGGGIGNLSWVERGPNNIAGRIRSLLIDPTNPSRMYAGSCGGGVWITDDAGLSWFPPSDFMGNLSIGAMAFKPGDPNTIYAGTGEGNIRPEWAIRGEGIWKSVDAGTTWTQMASTAAWQQTMHIAISPTNVDVILASTEVGVLRSIDGGDSWTLVLSGAGGSGRVVFDPNNSANCVAHYVVDGAAFRRHRIAYSSDAGVTWNLAAGLPNTRRIEMAYAPSVQGRIYASIGGGCWRSDDGGQSWAQQNPFAPILSSIWWWANTIWVDPTDSDYVLIGSVELYKSVDGGVSFVKITDRAINSNQVHADIHWIEPHPAFSGTNRQIYVCSDGGVHYSFDYRAASTTGGWERRDQNLRTVQYYGVAGHSSGALVGGTQDNGSQAINWGSSSSAVLTVGGDGTNSQIDSIAPNYQWGALQWSRVWRSVDGGVTYAEIPSGHGEYNQTGVGNFVAPLVSAKINPNILYSGANQLWRCSNAKATSPWWVSIKAPLSGADPAISAIAVSPNSADVVWVGHDSGRMFRTTNALSVSPTWTEVDMASEVPDRMITRILIDRNASNGVLVATSGFEGDNLWRTTDNGVSFTDVTGSGAGALPAAPLRGIAQHPTLDGRYYVATEVGVFGTSDDCSTWSGSNDGPADVACYDITFLHGSNTLLVGTHGRGMWTTEIAEPQVTSFGVGCAGTNGVPTLTATEPRLGQTCTVSGVNMLPNGNVWLVQGQSRSSWNGNPLPFDLSPFQAPGCSLRVRPDIVRDGAADISGNYSAPLPIAANTALLGLHIYLQAFPSDPTVNGFGRTSTNGIDLVIGN